ncbi:MAG: hypothetical protein ACYC7D_03555 [Nitrososphaerales archaeon]
MLIKIGDIEITKSSTAQYTIQRYAGGSIGIRGRVRSEEGIKSTEKELYSLREGGVAQIEVLTDEGDSLTGSYRINELHWGKERGNNDYELVFNIGLQKQ